MRIKYLLILVSLFVLSGCAKVWVKPGASTDDFNRDKYACLQQSQQQVSVLALGKYSGYGQSGQETNAMLYNSCMNSRGWTLTDQETAASNNSKHTNDMQLEMSRLDQQTLARCSDKQFALYYAKTACKAKDITLEQMGDKSRITSSQKPVLSSVQKEVKSSSAEYNAMYRKFGGTRGASFAATNETVFDPKYDKLYFELYNGKITWGEFNQKRKEIYEELIKQFHQAFGTNP